ncbi:MAG: iron-sulfur cluster assembly accessory protein [Betaproteobacteria bacterium]|nr:iron-sulfur cluster assembly accessory protein [Betaproteobacteria bacterium]
MSTTFTLTAAAAAQILRASEEQPEDTQLPKLRVAAKLDEEGNRAAGGILYGMGFDEERDNDLVLDCAGVTVLLAPPSQQLLNGATLDFVELKAGEYQFIFINPNEPTATNSANPAKADDKSGSCGSGGYSSSH